MCAMLPDPLEKLLQSEPNCCADRTESQQGVPHEQDIHIAQYTVQCTQYSVLALATTSRCSSVVCKFTRNAARAKNIFLL